MKNKTCQHNNQHPDKKRKVWVCDDCGCPTVAFLTAAERKAIAKDEVKWRNVVTVRNRARVTSTTLPS